MAAHEQRLVRARTKSQRALKEECETLELKEVRLREEVQAELCQPRRVEGGFGGCCGTSARERRTRGPHALRWVRCAATSTRRRSSWTAFHAASSQFDRGAGLPPRRPRSAA